MGRQLPPSHLKVPPGPHTLPPRFLGEPAVVVSHHRSSSFEKAIPVIPVIPAIPGFRTSAAFLTSLSVNLRIDPDLPSPLGTPTTFRASSFSHPPLPPPSPLSFSTLPAPRNPYPSPLEAEIMPSTEVTAPAKAPTDTLPTLTTYAAETEDDRIDGLRLVADSVAQQRQSASKQLIFHPVNLALYVIAVSIAAQFLLRDPLVLATTVGGITMIALACVRYATGGYLAAAEAINLDWLGEDKLIVVKWGEDVIGALVLGWADHDAAKKKGRRRRGKAVVRAWTVKLKYRGKGVGEGLLEEAVRVAGERGADGIVFENEHANSKRILPSLYNGFLDQKEARAEKALEKVADEKGNFRQRRSSPTWGSR